MDDRRGKNTLAATGSAATVHLQSLGRIRGSERCGAAVARSGLPVDRLREDLRAWGSVAFAPALVRDRGAEPRGEPGRSEPNQSGTDCEGGGHGFTQRVVLDMDSTEIPRAVVRFYNKRGTAEQ